MVFGTPSTDKTVAHQFVGEATKRAYKKIAKMNEAALIKAPINVDEMIDAIMTEELGYQQRSSDPDVEQPMMMLPEFDPEGTNPEVEAEAEPETELASEPASESESKRGRR